MARQDRFMQEVRTSIGVGVTDAAIQDALWQTLNDICREAYVWRETVEVPLIVDEIEYTVAVSGADIVQVFSVAHLTLDVTGVYYELGKLYIASDAPTAADVTAGPVYLIVALTPTVQALTDVEQWIPTDLWDTLHQALVAGAKYRLMAQPAKPYSNLALAQLHAREYRGLKAVERQRAATGNIIGAQQWRFPAFYVASRRQ